MLIVFLLIVTFASLALSAGLLTYVLRLTREERDRSEARAAALEQALGGAKPLERWSPEMSFASDAAEQEDSIESDGDLDLAPAAAPYVPYNISAHEAAFSPGAGSGDTLPPARSMFGSQEPTTDEWSTADAKSRLPRAILIPAAGVLVVALIAALALSVAWARNHGATTPAQASVQQSTGAPLELVALKHERVGDGLHISGVVRNPQDGHMVARLAAIAFLFDRDGNFLSSDRAPLDYVQLEPGEESPFSITVPSAARVSRYRVTFRTDAGIVAHVDRRSDPPVLPAASR